MIMPQQLRMQEQQNLQVVNKKINTAKHSRADTIHCLRALMNFYLLRSVLANFLFIYCSNLFIRIQVC